VGGEHRFKLFSTLVNNSLEEVQIGAEADGLYSVLVIHYWLVYLLAAALEKMSGQTTQLRGINTQYESIG
jgi:hypothetical protein